MFVQGTYNGKKQRCLGRLDQWDWKDAEEGEEVEDREGDDDGEETSCAGHCGVGRWLLKGDGKR